MLDNILDANPPLHVSIQHLTDEIQAVLAHHVRYTQVVVHDLVDAVERVLLVDDGIQQDTERPDVLLFTSVGQAPKDFWCCVVCASSVSKG